MGMSVDQRAPGADVVDVAVAVDVPDFGPLPAIDKDRISPDRARWAREERTVTAELADGSVIVELGFAGVDWLVREVLKEAGDAVVLEPDDARGAVLSAALEIRHAADLVTR